MNILVLEDDVNRIKIFKQNLWQDGVYIVFVDKVPDCIAALETQDWDALFLDHDLGGKVYVQSDGEELTGWHVAKWLSEHPEKKPKTIIVHSYNEAGRQRIISLLPEALDRPGAWLTAKIQG